MNCTSCLFCVNHRRVVCKNVLKIKIEICANEISVEQQKTTKTNPKVDMQAIILAAALLLQNGSSTKETCAYMSLVPEFLMRMFCLN